MENSNGIQHLLDQFDRELADFLASLARGNGGGEGAGGAGGVGAGGAGAPPRVGAEPRRGRRVRRYIRDDLHVMLHEQAVEEERAAAEEGGERRRRRRRGRGMYRGLDADDLEAWGFARRRRRPAGGAGGGAGGEGGDEEEDGGAGEVIDMTVADELVPIINLAAGDSDEEGETSGEGEGGEGAGQEVCCIAACCQSPPVFTWLRCCRNEEACIHCIEEHVRRSGWTCPLCRGDMRA